MTSRRTDGPHFADPFIGPWTVVVHPRFKAIAKDAAINTRVPVSQDLASRSGRCGAGGPMASLEPWDAGSIPGLVEG